MLRSDWGIVVAAFGCLALAALGLNNSEERRYNAERADSARKQTDQIDRNRAGIPALAESYVSNPDPQGANETERRDLAAQEASAVGAFWMVVISSFGTLITFGGTLLLLEQIKLTRRAVEDTGRATQAMREGNQIARDSFAMSYKPWLVPKITGIYIPARDFQPTIPIANEARRFPIKAGLAAQNIGDMPATIIGYRMTLATDHPNFQLSRDDERDRFDVVGKGESRTLLPDHNLVATFIFDQAIRVGFMMEPCAIIGSIDYLDTMGRRYQLGFGFKPVSVSEPGYARWGGKQFNYDRPIPD